MKRIVPAVLFILLLAVLPCGIDRDALAEPAAQTPEATEAPASKAPVARIVFIDKENCCKCTQEKTDKSWSALQAALKDSALTVERFHLDTQPDQADVFRKLKPVIAVPAIYFLDEGGALVQMLQGEVTTQQIKAVLEN